MDSVPLVALQREWEVLSRGRLRLELRAWAAHEAALARFESPDRLIGFLLDRRVSPADKDQVLLALLRLARREASAGRVVLHAMLPGLKRLAGVLLKRGPNGEEPVLDREAVWELLFLEMLGRIKTYPLERRPRKVAANLIGDVKHAAYAELDRARHDLEEVPEDPLEPELLLRPRPGVNVEGPLRRAVAAKAITAADAELLLLIGVDGLGLREAAERLGLPYNLARIRVQRARKRLLMFLRPWTQDLYVQAEPKRASDAPSSGAYAPEELEDTQQQAG
ncbi:MAG TPA: sigma factor-like helix-turn-helix DNA-binding protein [Solirubrobacteraceae bacterium]|jgi:DNA-directed RNA polymerase specialized sigma24 family protein